MITLKSHISGLPANDSTEWMHFRKEYYCAHEKGINNINKWLIELGMSQLPPNARNFDSPYLNIYTYPKEIDYTDMRPLPSKWVQFDAFIRNGDNQHFDIPKQLKERSGKLILFSMGSLVPINVKMMKRLIEMLSQTPHRYIVSKG